MGRAHDNKLFWSVSGMGELTLGLMRTLAVEYGPRGIRVNALLPGGTDTAMAREMNGTPEAMDFVRSIHALKRIADPEEIARAALFLASNDAYAADSPLAWMLSEARKHGMFIERHVSDRLREGPDSKLHESRRSFYRLRKKHERPIKHGKGDTLIHRSVKERWDSDPGYRPPNLKAYVEENGWTGLVD